MLSLSAINSQFVSDNYKFDFPEVWQSLTILSRKEKRFLNVLFYGNLFSPFKQNNRMNQISVFRVMYIEHFDFTIKAAHIFTKRKQGLFKESSECRDIMGKDKVLDISVKWT